MDLRLLCWTNYVMTLLLNDLCQMFFLPQPRLEDCDKFYEAPRSATEMLCDAEL